MTGLEYLEKSSGQDKIEAMLEHNRKSVYRELLKRCGKAFPFISLLFLLGSCSGISSADNSNAQTNSTPQPYFKPTIADIHNSCTVHLGTTADVQGTLIKDQAGEISLQAGIITLPITQKGNNLNKYMGDYIEVRGIVKDTPNGRCQLDDALLLEDLGSPLYDSITPVDNSFDKSNLRTIPDIKAACSNPSLIGKSVFIEGQLDDRSLVETSSGKINQRGVIQEGQYTIGYSTADTQPDLTPYLSHHIEVIATIGKLNGPNVPGENKCFLSEVELLEDSGPVIPGETNTDSKSFPSVADERKVILHNGIFRGFTIDKAA